MLFISYNVCPLVLVDCLNILQLDFLVTAIFPVFVGMANCPFKTCTFSSVVTFTGTNCVILHATHGSCCLFPFPPAVQSCLCDPIRILVSNFRAQVMKLQNSSGKTITWFSWVLLTIFWKEIWCLIINHLDTAGALLAILVKFVSPEFTNENEWDNFSVPTNSPKPLLLLNRQQL